SERARNGKYRRTRARIAGLCHRKVRRDSRSANDRYCRGAGRCTFLRGRRHSPARCRNHPRPGRNCSSHGPSLRAAGYAAFWNPGYSPSLVRPLQHQTGGGCAGRRYWESAGGIRLMSDLRDLYQELILEHSKAPRNFRKLPVASHKAEGYNPLCGDHLTLYLNLEGDSIREISFEGSGCAISKASASMMTQAVKGKNRADAERLFVAFHKLITGEENGGRAELGKLAVFSGVSEFPVRVKCATLAWHALKAALQDVHATVSTE